MDFALIPEPKPRRANKGETYLNRYGCMFTWSESAPTIEEYTVFRRVPMDRVTVREPEPQFTTECEWSAGKPAWFRVFRKADGETSVLWRTTYYPDAEKFAVAECARLNDLAARGEIPT